MRIRQLPRREYPAVAGDNATIRIDQNWVNKAEFGDAGRNLRNLCVRMGASIPGIRNEPLDGRRNLLLRPSRMTLGNHAFVFGGTYPAGSAEPSPKK
jgi:hypothetical protein